MAVCIQQGKQHYIKRVVISYVAIKGNYRLFTKGAVTEFLGKFTLLEKIQLHGAAPSLILVFVSVIFFLILFLSQLPPLYIILLLVFLFVSPLVSLFPFKVGYASDGYCVIKYARRLQLTVLQTLGQVLQGIFLALRYVLLGTRAVRKYNTKLASAFKSVKSGDFKNALSILEKEFKNKPNNSELCNNIAWCYAELGTNLDRAIMLAKKAIDLDSGEAVYHDTLGWCHYKNGDFDRAKDYVNRAIKIDPDNSIFQDHMKAIESAMTQIAPKKRLTG